VRACSRQRSHPPAPADPASWLPLSPRPHCRPQATPEVWLPRSALEAALLPGAGAEGASYALSRIGGRRLGPHDILRGRLYGREYLMLREVALEATDGGDDDSDASPDAPASLSLAERLALPLPPALAAALAALPPPAPGDATAEERSALLAGALPESALAASEQSGGRRAAAAAEGDGCMASPYFRHATCALVSLLRVRERYGGSCALGVAATLRLPPPAATSHRCIAPRRPPLTPPQAIPGVWIQKRRLREALVARGHPSAGYATARIGNRRLGGYEVLRGRQGNSDYLLLRAATEEAAAALPPTPELAAAGTRRCATFADLTESDVSMSGDEADGESDGDDNGDGDEADGDGDEADGDGDGSSSEPESADWVSGAGDASPVQPLQEGASEQAFLLSIIAALQARAPPARVRSLTAAAAASPPAGTHPLLQTLRPPPLTSYRVPFRC